MPKASKTGPPVRSQRILRVPLSQIHDNPQNHRKHSKQQQQGLDAVVQEIGWYGYPDVFPHPDRPGSYMLVDGAMRRAHLVAKHGETAAIDVNVIDFSRDEARKALATKDALAAMAGTEQATLDKLMAEIDPENENFAALLREWQPLEYVDNEELEETPTPDPSEALREKWDVNPGDFFRITGKAEHFVLVGDATSQEHTDRLFAAGSKPPFLMVTDPPYGVSYRPSWRHDKGLNNSERIGQVQNDDRCDWTEAWDLFPGRVAYVWHAGWYVGEALASLEAAGFATRNQIIWRKPSIVIGRGHYHWQHEPCHPPGVRVHLGGLKGESRSVPIEQLSNGDHVATWIQGVKVSMRGRPVEVATRHYQGWMHTLGAGGHVTRATHDHHWTVRRSDGGWVTYLMRRGSRWRVGQCLVNREPYGFGPAYRLRREDGDAVWLLRFHDTAQEARAHEEFLAIRYGIPMSQWHSEDPRVTLLYVLLGDHESAAIRLLNELGRDIRYPLLTGGEARSAGRHAIFSRKYGSIVRSCNLVPGVFEIPVPTFTPRPGQTSGREGYEWAAIDAIGRQFYDGPVYSLAVPGHEHYIADGLITHNCLYATRKGSPKWKGELGQTSVWEITNRVSKAEGQTVHGTQKPLECMGHPIRNHGTATDPIYDPFLSTGTTAIAADRLERPSYGLELDPIYAAVILERFENEGATSERLE